MIQAIETRYNGYRFRSRTEARWAVFFDALDVKYEYEKEGFHLPSGSYLPDFWIKEYAGKWVEIKGDLPTSKEIMLCSELAEISGRTVVLIWGQPRDDMWQCIYIHRRWEELETFPRLGPLFFSCYTTSVKKALFFDSIPRNKIDLAVEASRSARFEFDR